MAQTKPKAAQFYGVSDNGTDGEFLQTDGTGAMAWASAITNPTITSIDYPGTATAANPAGGESVIINGTLFASGITCTVGGTTVTTVFNSATQITINTPAKSAGAYAVAVTNSNGGTVSQANFIQYSGIPIWTTAAGNIGSVLEGEAASFQVTATEGSDTIEYAVTTGALPTGLSLATATGAITGTAPAVSADTTTTFSITATDDENQTSAVRSFNIIVTNDGPSNHFNTVLYTGNNTNNQVVTGVGFKPDFTWISRINAGSGATNKGVWDSVIGTAGQLYSNLINTQTNTPNRLYSFDSDGFTLGNGSDPEYIGNNNWVSWNFKAGGAATTIAANTVGNTIASDVSVNNTLGFSIVKYQGNATNSTIAHGLSSAPEMMIIKSTTVAQNWATYHKDIGNQYWLQLNSSVAKLGSAPWNNTNPTNNVFYIGTGGVINANLSTNVAYCFTSKAGFSKVGFYTGNNGSNIIQTDFEPAFLLIKNTSSSNNWIILDNKRSPVNQRKQVLYPNSNAVESTQTVNVNFLTNGFELTNGNSDVNDNGATYIYLVMAADGSTATPSLANSFATEIYAGNGGTQSITTGLKPDFTWIKNRTNGYSHQLYDSVRGTGSSRNLQSDNTKIEGSDASLYGFLSSFDTNGYTVQSGTSGGNNNIWTNQSGQNFVAWNWKAAGIASINTTGTITGLVSANQAAGFSISKYNHTTTSGTFSVGHGLGAVPELVFFKCLITGNSSWLVYYAFDETKTLVLDGNGPAGSSGQYWPTSPSSSVFNFGTAWASYFSYYGGPSIMYSFKSIAGYSKVGTYTGTGGALTVTTGFEPGFVMIKRTDASGSWVMVDEKRASGDNRLYANSANAEDAGQGESFISTGFKPRQSATNDTNTSGGTYIYLAIKEN